jgi:hypothetical protein
MAEPKVTAPKQGELVTCTQQEGIFKVVGVNTLMQTANIRLEDGRRHVIPSVPLDRLKGSRQDVKPFGGIALRVPPRPV